LVFFMVRHGFLGVFLGGEKSLLLLRCCCSARPSITHLLADLPAAAAHTSASSERRRYNNAQKNLKSNEFGLRPLTFLMEAPALFSRTW